MSAMTEISILLIDLFILIRQSVNEVFMKHSECVFTVYSEIQLPSVQ